MKKLTLVVLLLMQIILGFSQTKISGTVQDVKGTKLAGVNISIADSYDGGTSDLNGHYSFTTSEKGEAIVFFSMVGYVPCEHKLTISKDSVKLDVILKENTEELDAVVVTAGSFEAGDKKRAATVLTPLDVVTTGGVNADIVAAIKTLPGAQQLGEQEGLAVRGGATYETNQYIDGLLVTNPFYTGPPNIAQRGRFSPTLFKGTIFSTGGYSALYGQALSSALILESVDLPEQSQAYLSLSSAFWGGGVQRLADNKKSSWGIEANYTNVSPYYNIVKQNVDFYTMPEFLTTEGNFRVKTPSGGIIKYYTYFSKSKTGIATPNIDYPQFNNNLDINNTNWYNNLTWREYLNHDWKMNLGLSYSYNLDKFHQQVYDAKGNPVSLSPSSVDSVFNFNANTRKNFAQGKAIFEKKMAGNNIIRFGADYWFEDDDNTLGEYNKTLTDNLVAVFAESDVYLSRKLAVKLGGRTEYSSILNRWNVAPRVSAAYQINKVSQVSVAYGMFYQKPQSNILLATTKLQYQQASHYIVNYNYNAIGRSMRVEAFYKTYTDLIKTTPTYNNSGDGYARGLELYWRDKVTFGSFFDYWVSYSYVDTKRDYLNYPERMQPNFAANHTATLVTKTFIPALQTGFNITYSLASGRPYYNLMRDVNTNNYYVADKGKTKMYNDMAFSVNYLTNVFGAYAIFVASVTNVFGQKHVFGYNYSTNGAVKQPITLTADRFYFVGVFLSWGIDRRQDILDGRY